MIERHLSLTVAMDKPNFSTDDCVEMFTQTPSMKVADDCQDEDECHEIDDELPSSITSTNVDDILAQELHQLSTEERNNIQYDMHGVGDVVEESAALVEEKLRELSAVLAGITKKTILVTMLTRQDGCTRWATNRVRAE